MAGPDKEEPVTMAKDSEQEIPVKASPPREKSPSIGDIKEKGPKEAPGASSSQSATPPDGGWGWAVVFASFMIHIIGIYHPFNNHQCNNNILRIKIVIKIMTLKLTFPLDNCLPFTIDVTI